MSSRARRESVILALSPVQDSLAMLARRRTPRKNGCRCMGRPRGFVVTSAERRRLGAFCSDRSCVVISTQGYAIITQPGMSYKIHKAHTGLKLLARSGRLCYNLDSISMSWEKWASPTFLRIGPIEWPLYCLLDLAYGRDRGHRPRQREKDDEVGVLTGIQPNL